jgi:AcrR family transcriptional regulator
MEAAPIITGPGVPPGRCGTDTRGTHIGPVRTGAGLLLRPGYQAGFAEHVQNGGNAEGQRLREGAGNEVHVRVDQAGKHSPATRVDHFVAFLGGRAGRAVGDQAVSEPDRSPVLRLGPVEYLRVHDRCCGGHGVLPKGRLRSAPAEPVSIDEIARMARVSRSTVYLVFGSRAGLFRALGADLLERGGFASMLAAASHPDAREALRGGIRGVAGMYAAHRDVLRALNSMAQLDADAVGGAVQKMDEGRAGGMAAHAQRLAEQGILRADVTVDAATDLLCLLTSFDSFDLLHTGRGLAAAGVAELLITAAERSLCQPPPDAS